MPTEAQRKAINKYQSKLAPVSIRIPPELKKQWDEFAAAQNISLRQLIITAIDEKMQRDTAVKSLDPDALLNS